MIIISDFKNSFLFKNIKRKRKKNQIKKQKKKDLFRLVKTK